MFAHPDSPTLPPEIGAIQACGIVSEPLERIARAAANMTALGEMTRGIAHDFRNVLCILTSGLHIAESSADDTASLKRAFAAMEEGIARGLKMTNRLLAFARQQELRPAQEDINSLLADLRTFLSYGAGPGIRVVLDLAPELPKCLVDPPQLNAAILNLIVNARDAMPGGGVVRISTARVHRGGATGGDYVRVRVRDNGVGMPAEVLARIFDPFFTTKGDNGTGLGVPQVQALMRQVYGSVSVHSTVGKGTAFDLFFPIPVETAADGEVSEQLDRWADEGGAIGAMPVPGRST